MHENTGRVSDIDDYVASTDPNSMEDTEGWDEEAYLRQGGSERVGSQWVSFAFPANVDAVLQASWRLYETASGGWTDPADGAELAELRERVQHGGEQALRDFLGDPGADMVLRVPSEPPPTWFLKPPPYPFGDGGTRGPGDVIAIIPLAIGSYAAATWLVGSINTWIKFGENVQRARVRLSALLSRPQRISDGQAIGIAAEPIYRAAGTDQLSFAFVHSAGTIRVSDGDVRHPGFVVGFYSDGGIWVAVVDPFGEVKSVAQLPMQLPPPPEEYE